jgi:RNA polymerase sigma-70 factor (ECF subfamily)
MTGRVVIRQAMARLSPEHRTMIYRAHFLKQTIAETATELDAPESVVRAELHDAMQALRRALADVRIAV